MAKSKQLSKKLEAQILNRFIDIEMPEAWLKEMGAKRLQRFFEKGWWIAVIRRKDSIRVAWRPPKSK